MSERKDALRLLGAFSVGDQVVHISASGHGDAIMGNATVVERSTETSRLKIAYVDRGWHMMMFGMIDRWVDPRDLRYRDLHGSTN